MTTFQTPHKIEDQIKSCFVRLALTLFALVASTHPLRAADPEKIVDAPGRWSTDKANQWYGKQVWLVGANYLPSNAINQPLLCTEFMARPNGSLFEPHSAMMKEAKTAAYCWGFVNGKSQTIYPWDSWTKTYDGPPPVWFHDILQPDGTPFRQSEVDSIRKISGAK